MAGDTSAHQSAHELPNEQPQAHCKPRGILRPPSKGKTEGGRRLSWCDEQGANSEPLEKVHFIPGRNAKPWGTFILVFILMLIFVRVIFTLIDLVVLNLSDPS